MFDEGAGGVYLELDVKSLELLLCPLRDEN